MLFKAAVAAAAATILLAGHSVLARSPWTMLESSEGDAELQSTDVKYYEECAALGLDGASCQELVGDMELLVTAIEGHPAMIHKFEKTERKAGRWPVDERHLVDITAVSSMAVRQLAARLSREPEAMARFKEISALLQRGFCERPQRLFKRNDPQTGWVVESEEGADLEQALMQAGQEPTGAGEQQHQRSSSTKPAGPWWSSWTRRFWRKSPASPPKDIAEVRVVGVPSGETPQQRCIASNSDDGQLVAAVESTLTKAIAQAEHSDAPRALADFDASGSLLDTSDSLARERPAVSHTRDMEVGNHRPSRWSVRRLDIGRILYNLASNVLPKTLAVSVCTTPALTLMTFLALALNNFHWAALCGIANSFSVAAVMGSVCAILKLGL